MALIPDNELREVLSENMPKHKNSIDRWNMMNSQVNGFLTKRKNKTKTTQNILNEIMLQFAYPRLDIAVSKGLNHLLKSPFCVHPKTGKAAFYIRINENFLAEENFTCSAPEFWL